MSVDIHIQSIETISDHYKRIGSLMDLNNSGKYFLMKLKNQKQVFWGVQSNTILNYFVKNIYNAR